MTHNRIVLAQVPVRAQNNRAGLRHSQEALSDPLVLHIAQYDYGRQGPLRLMQTSSNLRALLTEHLRVVTSNGYNGSDNARCHKTTAECRPQQR